MTALVSLLFIAMIVKLQNFPYTCSVAIGGYALYSAISLHSNIGKEQHEKHLCNSSSHYGKYGE